MPKVTAATLAVTGLLLVALTGCTGGAESAGDESLAPTASEPATLEESAAPLVTEPPQPTQEEAAPLEVESPEWKPPTKNELQSTWYGQFGKTLQLAGLEFPLLADALSVGQYVCDKSRAGISPADILAIQGLPAGSEYVNTEVVNMTLMNGYALTPYQVERGETLPDYCGTLFPAA